MNDDTKSTPRHFKPDSLPSATDSTPLLVPARMVTQWVYCPRLAYLEWVEGEWADSADTIEGKRVHARVDRTQGRLPAPSDVEDATPQTRSVMLSSVRLGVIAKMDVVETRNDLTIPVEFKKGKRPHVAAGAYEPERVQVCVQGMILEDNGYRVEYGYLWYAGSRERVRVVFDDELRTRSLKAIRDLRSAATRRTRPLPLVDSPKCVRCSLAGICLPDETNLVRTGNAPRPLNPADDPAVPLHVQQPGARLRKSGEQLIVDADGEAVAIPMVHVSQVSLFGPVSITTPALHALMRQNKAVSWFSTGGWFLGHTIGTGNGNVAVREAQYRAAFSQERCLNFARQLVSAKIRNSRTMLRRNWRAETGEDDKKHILARLTRVARRSEHAKDASVLLGIEGEAAAIYFAHLGNMIRIQDSQYADAFSFTNRSRRPPADPINAMLSFAYAVLTRVFSVTIMSTGLDPYMGLYHRPRHGRPALALDLMEPFRPIIADSCVIQVINNSEIRPKDFVHTGNACALTPRGRKAFLRAFERRIEQQTTHPVFKYRISMRRLIEVQARLLARHLQGEISDYPHYLPR